MLDFDAVGVSIEARNMFSGNILSATFESSSKSRPYNKDVLYTSVNKEASH